MKVEFLVENLENLLPTLTKFIPSGSQVPILSNFLIEAAKEGLFISSTNLESGIKVKIPAKIEEEGTTTVPGRQFSEIITSFPKDKVELILNENTLTIKCRGNKAELSTIPKEEFPSIYEEKGEGVYTFDKEELRDTFTKILFAASIEEARPELTGILFSQKKEEIDFVATDGFRLALKRAKGKQLFEEVGSLILPSRTISEALSLKSDVAMFIHKRSNQIIFEAENIMLVGRMINGDFPNYEKVIPQNSKTEIEVDREEFMQQIRLSSVFARESANIVRVEVKDGKLKLTAQSSGLGEGESIIEGKQKGEDNEIAFNVKFLMDFLKNVSEKTVTIMLSSGVEPALFKINEDPNYFHVIMPVRVQE